MRGQFGIDAEGGERYREPESERTWMPMLLDAIFFWYSDRYSDSELFYSSLGDALMKAKMMAALS